MGVSAGVFQSWIISKITNYRKPLRPTPFSKPNLQVDGLQDDASSPILIMVLCATAVLMGYQTLEKWNVIVFSFYTLHYIWVDIYWVNILCIVSLYLMVYVHVHVFGVQIWVAGSERVREDHLAELHRWQTTSGCRGDTGEGS